MPGRVRFSGAEYIEYEATQPVVVRFGGSKRKLQRTSDGRLSFLEKKDLLELEWKARGFVTETTTTSTKFDENLLIQQYVQELKAFIEAKGMHPVSEQLDELWVQLEWIQRLWNEVFLLDFVSENKENQTMDVQNYANINLEQLFLSRKELNGHFGCGYTFGRRFMSICDYLKTLELSQLEELMKARSLPMPLLSPRDVFKIKVNEREMIAKCSAFAGKLLKNLTFRELVLEAKERGLEVNNPDFNGPKKCKKKIMDKLKPIVRQDILKQKREDKMCERIEAILTNVLEKEMMQLMKEKMLHLLLQRLGTCSTSFKLSATKEELSKRMLEFLQQERDKKKFNSTEYSTNPLICPFGSYS